MVDGDKGEAFVQLQHLLEITRANRDYPNHINTLIQISQYHHINRQTMIARTYAEKAAKAAELLGDASLQMAALNHLANLKSAEGFYTDAVQNYRQALALKPPQIDLTIRLHLNLAQTLLKMDQPEAVTPLLQKLKILLKKAALTPDFALFASQLALEANQTDLAMHFADHAMAGALPQERSACFGQKGLIFLKSGNYPEAANAFRQAIYQSARQLHAPNLFLWQWHLGQTLNRQNKPKEAIQAYRHTIDQLNQMRAVNFPKNDVNRQFHDQTVTIYHELAELLINQLNELTADAQQIVLQELTQLIEAMKINEVKNYFQDDCVIEQQSRTRTLQEIIQPGTALIYTLAMEETLAVILYTDHRYKIHLTPITFAKLHHKITTLRILSQTKSVNIRQAAQALYQLILQPVAPQLKTVNHLVFIPDTPLQNLPWGALNDGSAFLAENYAISASTGLSLNAPAKLDPSGIRLLTAGVTDQLPYVKKELTEIAKIFAGKAVLDADFTQKALKFELRNQFYRIIHLATHADFTAGANRNYLMTGSGPMNMKQLEDWLKLSSLRENGIELLTLSACKTASGDLVNNMGLAGTAIRSGARSVLASLWQVDDRATALLMTEFYQNIKSGDSKATALQKAQLSLINHPDYNSPYYWAPFILIGNWL